MRNAARAGRQRITHAERDHRLFPVAVQRLCVGRILVRLGPDHFVAYDQQCTHLSCPVLPRPAEGKLHCPCHNGWFDLETGRPLAGPPRRALPRVLLEVRGDTVYATGITEESST